MTDSPTQGPTTRTVVVTGGNRGIGLACTRRFVDAGMRVATVSLSGAEVPGAFSVACDVSQEGAADEAVAAVEAELGPVEILVANAGIARDGLMVRMSDDDFAAVIDTNLAGSFRFARAVTKKMMRARFGRIIFMSSVGAYLGSPGQANYAASKAGLIGLGRSMARELASRKITVNVVTPGPIATDMFDELNDDQRGVLTAGVPLGRPGETGEVAAAVQFLASDDAGYITGVVLPVDGGMGMGF